MREFQLIRFYQVDFLENEREYCNSVDNQKVYPTLIYEQV